MKSIHRIFYTTHFPKIYWRLSLHTVINWVNIFRKISAGLIESMCMSNTSYKNPPVPCKLLTWRMSMTYIRDYNLSLRLFPRFHNSKIYILKHNICRTSQMITYKQAFWWEDSHAADDWQVAIPQGPRGWCLWEERTAGAKLRSTSYVPTVCRMFLQVNPKDFSRTKDWLDKDSDYRELDLKENCWTEAILIEKE